MLEIVSFTLGPAQTNAYLVADSATRDAAVIDPAWEGQVILQAAQSLAARGFTPQRPRALAGRRRRRPLRI